MRLSGVSALFLNCFLVVVAFTIGCPGSGGGTGGGDGTTLSVGIVSIPRFVAPDTALELSASVGGASGSVTYEWKVDGTVVGSTQKLTYTPTLEVDACDRPIVVSLSAKDSSNRTASAETKTMISKPWCTYTVRNTEGFLSNAVTKIAVAQNGGVWVGTDKGLNRFDGETWSQLTADNSLLGKLGASDTIKRNYISTIREQDGNVWVGICYARPTVTSNGTCGGVQRFSAADPMDRTKWATYSSSSSEASETNAVNYGVLMNQVVNDISPLNPDQMLVATRGGVNVVSLSTNRRDVNLIASHWVTAIAFDANGRRWYGTSAGITSGQGIWVYADETESKKGQIDGSQWQGLATFGNNTNITTLAANGQEMYVGLATGTLVGAGGFVRFIANGKVENNVPQGSWHRFDTTGPLVGNDIRKIVVGSKNSVWIATSAGLSEFSPGEKVEQGAWRSFTFDQVLPLGGFSTNDLTDLAFDKDNETLWIATSRGGVTRLRVALLN